MAGCTELLAAAKSAANFGDGVEAGCAGTAELWVSKWGADNFSDPPPIVILTMSRNAGGCCIGLRCSK